jgi:hypothetical protein
VDIGSAVYLLGKLPTIFRKQRGQAHSILDAEQPQQESLISTGVELFAPALLSARRCKCPQILDNPAGAEAMLRLIA